jgi:Coenzyme PQQ synthesis protein D (PqqD)
MTTYFAKKDEFIHTIFNDSTIWMNTINSNFVELNETSTFLMGLLENETFTKEQLIEASCKEYNITAEDCSKDINEALEELLNAGLLNVSVN